MALEVLSITTMPLAEARAQLSKLVDEAIRTHERVEANKNGRRAAVIPGPTTTTRSSRPSTSVSDAETMAGIRESESLPTLDAVRSASFSRVGGQSMVWFGPELRQPVTSWDALSPQLWVRLHHDDPVAQERRWLIAGSSLTHPGHFHVCSADGDDHRTVAYYELAETSPAAELWLDGFLNAQQVDLYSFLGQDDRLSEADDPGDRARWLAWNRHFLGRGVRYHPEPMPARDPRLDELGTPLPWCFVGALYRVWVDGDWTPAEPQPATDTPHDWHWPGSACEVAGEHEVDDPRFDDRDDLSVCIRCRRAERS